MGSPTRQFLLGAAFVCSAAFAVSACSHGAGPSEGTVRVSGSVHLDGSALADGSTARLRADDEVSVLDGTAVVSLPTGGQLELRRGSTVRFASGPDLVAGDLLVESGPRGPVAVASPVGPIAVTGAARLRRGLGVGIASYQGQATLAGTRAVAIGALEQTTVVVAGEVPDLAPLHLDATDTWDQRILGSTIALTTQLDSQSRYVTANAPPLVGATAAFYRRAVRQLAATPMFDDALLHSALGDSGSTPSPGEGLVAASIALAAPGAFPDRWHAIFGLRQRGAQWGIVALDQHADPSLILAVVAMAVDQVSLPPSPAPVPVPPSDRTPSPPVTTVPPPPSARLVTSPTTAPPGPAPASPGPTTPPSVQPRPAAPADSVVPGLPVLAPIVDPLVNLIRALLPQHT